MLHHEIRLSVFGTLREQLSLCGRSGRDRTRDMRRQEGRLSLRAQCSRCDAAVHGADVSDSPARFIEDVDFALWAREDRMKAADRHGSWFRRFEVTATCHSPVHKAVLCVTLTVMLPSRWQGHPCDPAVSQLCEIGKMSRNVCVAARTPINH